jgi:predicted O-methyltransferase YrrM
MISALLKILNQKKQEKILKKNYWKFISELLNKHPECISKEKAKEYEKKWMITKLSVGGPLQDGYPWVPFNAMEYMEKLLNKESKVFEFGIGGSTIFFSKRVGELISVEHDSEWFLRTEKAMADIKDLKWTGYLKEPQFTGKPITGNGGDPSLYTTTDESLSGLSFKDYVTTIDKYEDKYFDLILIDGRSRPSCFMHALPKIKDSGYIVLDNAEREAYRIVEDISKSQGLKIEEFWGPGPYNDHGWRTIFIRK